MSIDKVVGGVQTGLNQQGDMLKFAASRLLTGDIPRRGRSWIVTNVYANTILDQETIEPLSFISVMPNIPKKILPGVPGIKIRAICAN